jgi:hypothetical protein
LVGMSKGYKKASPFMLYLILWSWNWEGSTSISLYSYGLRGVCNKVVPLTIEFESVMA